MLVLAIPVTNFYTQFEEFVISASLLVLIFDWGELQDRREGLLQVLIQESNPSLVTRDLRPRAVGLGIQKVQLT